MFRCKCKHPPMEVNLINSELCMHTIFEEVDFEGVLRARKCS